MEGIMISFNSVHGESASPCQLVFNVYRWVFHIGTENLISLVSQVYVSKLNIDDDLVSSIVDPAQDPNAPDVFYRVISSNGASINSLLQKIKARSCLNMCWSSLHQESLCAKTYSSAPELLGPLCAQ